MNLSHVKYIMYGIGISITITTIATYAAGLNGIFGDYFDRMTGYCTISSPNPEILTGLAGNSDTPLFGTKRCTTLKSLIGSLFSSAIPPGPGQVLTGFDSTGNPTYGNTNWINIGSNISYTGAQVLIGSTTDQFGKLQINNGSWALTTFGQPWTYNNQPMNSQGSLYVNDIFLRSSAKWMSQVGGIPPGYEEVTTTYPDLVVGVGNPTSYNCGPYAGTNASVQGLAHIGFAWGAPAIGQPWYWGGKYYGSDYYSLIYDMAKTTETKFKRIRSVTGTPTYMYINDIRKGCGGDTIPFSGVGFTVKYYDMIQLIKFN